MANQNRNQKKVPKPPKRPENFNNFTECVKWLKKSVYLIVRGRQEKIDGKELIKWTTLGSGFIAAPYRLVTAGHVIDDPKKGEIFKHHDGDKYYLLRHDDISIWHIRIFEPKINSEIFLYPDLDISIINLDNEFYQVGDKIFVDRNDFIRISKEFLPLGLEVGVLGYPLCNLEFENNDINKPKLGNILLRADAGVINCRYQTSATNYLYEFTMAFNPGNSGGPIFDVRNGRLISIVQGYKAIRINESEVIIPLEGINRLKEYKEKSFIEVLHATYSFGLATPSYIEIFKKHNIIS